MEGLANSPDQINTSSFSVNFTSGTTMSPSEHPLTQFLQILKQLRAPNGCPWDKKQTISSLEKYLRAEFDEVVEAIQKNDQANLCEELGDLLYVIAMMAQIAEEDGQFSFKDVIDSINQKLIRRHPHVFLEQKHLTDQELRQQWHAIKLAEKAAKAGKAV